MHSIVTTSSHPRSSISSPVTSEFDGDDYEEAAACSDSHSVSIFGLSDVYVPGSHGVAANMRSQIYRRSIEIGSKERRLKAGKQG